MKRKKEQEGGGFAVNMAVCFDRRYAIFLERESKLAREKERLSKDVLLFFKLAEEEKQRER